MHGVSVHSALAIKRQRKRRDNAAKRAKRRSQGRPVSEANLGGGGNTANKMMGTVTTLHVGIIFSLIGFLFLVSALIPSSTTSRKEMFNLLATSATCLAIGAFLVCLNRFYGNREEEELSNYVEAQLARTTSGHRLVRDPSEINLPIRSANVSGRNSTASPDCPVVIDIQDCSLESPAEGRGKDTYRVYDKQRPGKLLHSAPHSSQATTSTA